MPLIKNINPFSKRNANTGFGINANNYGGRFVNKDGSFNLVKTGIPLTQRYSAYQHLLTMPRWKFAFVIFVFYLAINLFYTIVYFIVGINGLQGIIEAGLVKKFWEVFFFSTETFTTVGYGRVNPVSMGVNAVAAIESMNGFLSFAIATGLIYGRFTRPRGYLAFSEQALIAPYKDKTGLMFRVASYKENHHLTNADATVNVGFTVLEDNNPVFRFYNLELELPHIESLSMNWTIVHPIDEKSPLLGFSEDDFKTAEVEVYVMIRGFDDVFSSTVIQRTSYTYQEIKFGARFKPMYHESEDGNTTILELDKLNQYVEVKI
jgi:inward rectifier potassium channel